VTLRAVVAEMRQNTSNGTAEIASPAEGNGSAPGIELRLSEEQFHAHLEGLTRGWGGISKMARIWGVDPTDLSRVVRRIQTAGPKLLKALNVRIEKSYVITVDTD